MLDRRGLQRVEILSKNEGLGFVSLCGRPSLPPAGRNPQKLKILDFKPLVRGVIASGGSKSLQIEGLGFFKPLWRIVVDSSGSKSSNNAGLEFLNLCGGSFWPPASRNSQKLKILGFKLLLRGVIASGDSKSSQIEALGFLSHHGGSS